MASEARMTLANYITQLVEKDILCSGAVVDKGNLTIQSVYLSNKSSCSEVSRDMTLGHNIFSNSMASRIRSFCSFD